MEALSHYVPVLARGAETTVIATLVSAPLALVVAVLVATARLYLPRPVGAALTVYVEFFRGTPLLLQLFWLFFALPFAGITLVPLVAGVLGLTLNFGAYASEVVRAGILAVPRGQFEAATVLGLGRTKTLRHVVLPQTLVLVLPPLGNNLIELLKATSLLSLILVSDILFYAQQLLARGNDPTGVFLTIGAFYFAVGYPLSLLMRRFEARNARRGS
jgi:polar amino acid transport system permease protein